MYFNAMQEPCADEFLHSKGIHTLEWNKLINPFVKSWKTQFM